MIVILKHFLGIESEEARGGAICNTDKIFLRYEGEPGFQTGVAADIGVHQTSVSKVVRKVADHMMEKCGRWMKFSSTPADVTEAKRKWQ